MAGKLLGVGAVGLTQILVWVVIAGVFALPAMAMQPSLERTQIPPAVLVAFAVFFLLGYLLYSTMYATIGAITTTEQEGQQLQFVIVIPLVLSVFMLGAAVSTPDAPGGSVDVDGTVLRAGADVRANRRTNPAFVADRSIAVLIDRDHCGTPCALRKHLSRRHTHVWETGHAARKF